jgi:hypothetical protein
MTVNTRFCLHLICIVISYTCLAKAALDAFNTTYKGTLGLDQIEYIEVKTSPLAVTYIDLTITKCGGVTSLLSRYGALPALARYDILIPLSTDKHGVCSARARTTSATRQVCSSNLSYRATCCDGTMLATEFPTPTLTMFVMPSMSFALCCS